MPIFKALVPAAGFGTRMLPAAKAVPKEMLPILNRPTIQYVLEEAVAAGIDDVCMVVSADKKAIEDHFDHMGDLERRLADKGRLDYLASVFDVMSKSQVFSVRQREQLGLGHAVLQGKRHVGDEPFLCMLGDTIFSGGEKSPAQQLIEAQHAYGGSVIGLEKVPAEKVSRYGVAGGSMVAEGVMKIETFVEKPDPADAPSDLAIAARYALSPTIFPLLEETRPGKGGEIQLTDALLELCRREPVHGVVLQSRRHDIGNPLDWLKTNLYLASQDPELKNALTPLVRELFA
ncbi:MAG: UTP--glucose-1-phosphate uridylyltransferase [Phycisphaerae bacterium]